MVLELVGSLTVRLKTHQKTNTLFPFPTDLD